jgi:hypothetical protein
MGDDAYRELSQWLQSPDFQCHDVRPDPLDARPTMIRRESMPLPDLSSLSFEDCAAVVKSMERIPFTGVDEVLHYSTSILIEHVWTRLLDLDTKRGTRVINSAMRAGARKRRHSNTPSSNTPQSAA